MYDTHTHNSIHGLHSTQQLTVFKEEVHWKVPVGDHHSQGAGELNGKGARHTKPRPGSKCTRSKYTQGVKVHRT